METIQELKVRYDKLQAENKWEGPSLKACFNRILNDDGNTSIASCEKHIREGFEDQPK